MQPEFHHVRSRHPSAYSPETKKRFWDLFKQLGNAAAAAEKVGVPADTATRWVRDYERRVAKWRKANGGGEDAH